MKTKRLTSLIMAILMLVTTCCGFLSACTDSEYHGDGVFTITFNANGGTVNPSSATTTDRKLASLPTPFKENTEFLGWYLSSEFRGERLTVNYEYSFSCLIHAKWGETQSTEYTVSFDANGGTLAAYTTDIMTVNGKLLNLPDDPTPPANSTFLGWYSEKTVGDRIDTDYTFTGDKKEVTVYAHYRQEYVITFDSGVGTIDETSRITTSGRLMGTLPTPTNVPDGKTFVAWYTQNTGGKRVKSTTVFTEDSTIYALYLEDGEYMISFDPNGGSFADDIDELFTTNAKLSYLPDPTPDRGYGFVGWFTAKTGGDKVEENTEFTDSITIYAQYRMVEFFVSFDANGGRLSESVTLITDNFKLERLPYRPFAPQGQRFIGWFTEIVGGTQVDLSYEFKGTPGAVTVYAQYGEASAREDDGLWADDINEIYPRGRFQDANPDEVWAYDVNFEPGVPLEIWYGGELIIDIMLDDYSTDKVKLSPDKMLRLADGADISNSIINVLYKFSTRLIYVQEVRRATFEANDGIYIESTKKYSLDQNIASEEVWAKNVVIGAGGTKELTVVLGGKTVEVAHFSTATAVKAMLSADKKNVIIAEGTYNIYYNYGATEPSDINYRNLYIDGVSTGDLPEVDGMSDSPYYMVGSSATLGLDWNPISSVNLIPSNIHLMKTGDDTYEITVDLYAGNQFKILKAGDGWNGAYDYTSLVGNTGSTKYFSNSTDRNNNVVVNTDGNYTLIINSTTKKLSFVRNGEAGSVKMTYDIYIHGSFATPWSGRIAATNKASGTVTFEFTFTAGLDFGIMVKPYGKSNQVSWAAYGEVKNNNTNGGIVQAASDNNMTCKISGTYRFTFTLDSSGQVSSITIDTVV